MLQNGLNTQQERAVTAGPGATAIVAGPGTGKTKTLVARIEYLLKTGVSGRHILALTFTKKSAEELHMRLGRSDVWSGTFHALAHEILGGSQTFITDFQRSTVIKELKKTEDTELTARELGLAISRAKNTNDASLSFFVGAYNQKLAELGVIDFDDLLIGARDLLKTNAQARAQWHSRFTHILVDEFQDTNPLQYDLLQLLDTRNLFVIGDPLQS
ncbi:MAG TPA: UvrD-helicase domain-containing protein, partial [Candidatus Saccharimonadales bacterium]|nr:UvrD-helicase domain-containing protein [Candidatus Saccharimonadales bacterium]